MDETSRFFFFSNAAAVQRLRTEAASWIGTPFWPDAKAKGKGGGIDCVGLVEEVLGAAGVAGDRTFLFPRTSADFQSHRTELRILKMLRGQFPDDPQSAALAAIFEELPLPEVDSDAPAAMLKYERPRPMMREKMLQKAAKSVENLSVDRLMPGDLLILRNAGEFHLPIVLEGRIFIHCSRPFGAQLGDIHDPTFSFHLDAHFRARALTSIASYGAAADAGVVAAQSKIGNLKSEIGS
jgi:cell wall-associated NlpC family hydrolase